MNLFRKIFTLVLIIFIIVFVGISYFYINQEVSNAQENIIEQYNVLGNFLAKELEVGYLESRWPFENLQKLSTRKDFIFWWVVKDDNSIYLADQVSSMNKSTDAFFPEIKISGNIEKVILNSQKNYGIFIKQFSAGKMKWTFWIGFSLSNINKMAQNFIFMTLVFTFSALLIIGIILYFIVSFFLKPIQQLVVGTKTVAAGNLDYQIPIKTKDELGQLAIAFNNMTLDLKKSRQEIQDYNTNLEKKIEDRTKELNERAFEAERMNKLIMGRELKMVELKERIKELETELANKDITK